MVKWIEHSAQETEVVGSSPGHGKMVLWNFFLLLLPCALSLSLSLTDRQGFLNHKVTYERK